MTREIRAFQGRFGRAVLFDTDTPVVAHAHAQCHVLIKCGGADGHYVVNGVWAPFRDDTIVLVNPWVPHHNPRAAGGSTSRVLALYLETVGRFERGPAADAGFHHAKPFAVPSAAISPAIRICADRLAATMIANNDAEAHAGPFLADLVERILSTYGGRPPHPDDAGGRARLDFRIRRAMSHMQGHVSKQTGMTQLARMAGLSRSHFFELFRCQTGLSPRLYRDALCLDAAARNLVATADPLAEIARTLGFSAPGNFSRFFQQHTSVSPSDYRRAALAIDSRHADAGPRACSGRVPG